MREALAIYARFLRIGLHAFGGPFTQIATLQRELVVNEKWTTNARFNRVLAVYQALPGPEATEMCIWLGAVRAGRVGAIAAGLGFLTPGTLLVILFAWLYARFGLPPVAAAAMAGAQAAALALLCNAVRTLGQRACTDSTLVFIAVTAGLTSLGGMHFGVILVLSALAGYLTDRGKNWAGFGIIGGMAFFALLIFLWRTLSSQDDAPPLLGTGANAGKGTAIEGLMSGAKAGLLSFGGAYTAVPFLRDDAILINNWMKPSEFLDGLAVVNTLPTPLISLAGFVGFIAGGWPVALVMLAAVYLPAFAFSLVGHGRIERLVDNEPLHAALDGAAAGVVGLVGAAAVLLFKATFYDSPNNWTITGGIFIAALAVAVRYRPIWVNPAVIIAAAAIGAFALRA
ncbi:MAG TPA: chromate efflux transporter [Phycisphaerales bacterium]|nr:chromate efflux transporter [Phycisphaerales bacterium]